MTINPFAGIITPQLNQLFDDMISSLICGPGSLSVPCVLNMGTSAGRLCVNCNFDSIGNKSAGIYNGTGPNPFPENSICPMCGGIGFVSNDVLVTIYMGVLWAKNKFISMTSVDIATIDCQTLSVRANYPQIKAAKEISIDSDVEGYTYRRFQRVGDPEFRGFGQESFIITGWRRAG